MTQTKTVPPLSTPIRPQKNKKTSFLDIFLVEMPPAPLVTRLTILVCWYIAIRHITTELLSKCFCPDKNPVLCPKFLRCIACGSFSVLFPRTVSVYCIHESRLKSTGSRVGKPRKDCFSAFALTCGFGAFLRHYFGAFTVAEYIQFSKSFDILL